jgi:DNA (cytosine-5)-methyltransferase 1
MTQDKLKLLDLFSGIGGFSLGLERTGGFETVAFCEYDEKAQKVLKKHWPDVPIYKDVRTLDYDGAVDIITGGYPCQPFSVAGKRKGKEDDRHLWPAMFSLIKKHKPNWVIGENVAGHINMGLDAVLADLESEGYGTRTFVIPAVAVDAKHRRDRVWIVGHSEHDGSSSIRDFGELQGEPDWTQKTIFEFEGTGDSRNSMENTNNKRCEKLDISRKSKEQKQSCGADDANVANTNSVRVEGTGAEQQATRVSGESEVMANATSKRQSRQGKFVKQMRTKQDKKGKANNAFPERRPCQWEVEPAVGRVANGIPGRVDRLKQLGNAVVPQIPELIGNAILEVENYNTINTKSKKEQ